jgi:SagB-type dehydrogenase family enzyme
MLRAIGQDADASEAYDAALKIAEELQDVRGQAHASQRLGRIFLFQEQPRNEAVAFEVTLYDEVMTDFVFETDLLVDGPRERRIIRWTEETDPPVDGVHPMLLPCARTWMDEEGAVRFGLPLGEPNVERHPDCTVMRRIRREVAVSGNPGVLWQLISEMDGARAVAEILSRLPARERAEAARMLAALVATGIIDVSGRPVGRFLHLATKKGVLPAGGLEGDAVLQLATDGSYRAYPDAPRIAVSEAVPDRLRPFHALTRSRRSRRDYRGLILGRGDFDALLHTACGVTGATAWAGREVKLRAYPSSGALYAVEIYPVVFRVEGLEPAVYHYRTIENVLEMVRPGIDPASVVGAALPVERDMVAGAAVLFCLAGCFLRHERKYGEGGYRMLVAEAGHISQNLILAATALGLSARPFGGVFDDLLNHDLGLNGAEEQFLLAVLVGHAGGEASTVSS